MMMKKMMMAVICGLMVVSAITAGDVYELKLSSNVPIIRQSEMYYKDFTSTTYKGYVNIECDEDGYIINPSDAVLYGTFADGKATREMSIDLSVLNIYSKKQNKVEIKADGSLDSIALTLTGTGNCKTTIDRGNSCSDAVECTTPIKITNASGRFTGVITDVLCSPCDDNPWTWIFNNCAEKLTVSGDTDVAYGSWSMRYNKSLSSACNEVGFPECVMDKIPKAYLPTVE